MDVSAFWSAVIGGIFTLVGAFGAIYLTFRHERKKEAKTKYIEKIEEIGVYMPELYRWYKEESAMYWDPSEEEYIYEPPFLNKYDCPFYEIENLVNWWIPTLRKQVQQIRTVFSFFEDLRGYEGATLYQHGGDMQMLASELQSYDKVFEENYNYIWNKIGEEAKKAVPNKGRS